MLETPRKGMQYRHGFATQLNADIRAKTPDTAAYFL